MAFARASVLGAASLGIVAALSACSKSSPAGQAHPAATVSPTAAHGPAKAQPAFTVAGDHPVQPNGSQDTNAATPDAQCNSGTLAADKTLAARIATGFTLAGFSASAQLLQHFLSGKGTEVSYQAGLADLADGAGKRQLQDGQRRGPGRGCRPAEDRADARAPVPRAAATHRLRGQDQRPVLGISRHAGPDRYRHRQPLERAVRRLLTYVIRDSYGFPASDTLGGFGAPMRYLQTVCGAPEHRGGARWFPDTITVTVPFTEPA